MPNNNSAQFFSKKAHEICYALFRIASSVKRQSFAHHLEDQGLVLLESVAVGDYCRAELAARTIDRLLGIGSDVNLISPANAEVITHELEHFNTAIAGFINAASPVEINLDGIFSKVPVVGSVNDTANPKSVETSSVSVDRVSRNNGYSDDSLDNGNGGHSVVKAAMRQSAILERVRQNGNCRLKEIQEILPAVSERTLRYDIQNLIGQGIIERVGNGGPATHYRTKT